MINRKLAYTLMVAVMAGTLVLTGCSDSGGEKNSKTTTEGGENNQQSTGEKDTQNTTENAENNNQTDNTDDSTDSVFTKYDNNATWDDTATSIELSKGDVIITEPGTYVLSGKLENGQVNVNVDSAEKVKLVLNGVDITCKDSAAIYVVNADKVAITLAEGTTNVLTDGGNADTTDADGCIYSKDDLTINGTGKLIVNGKVKNGIDCNNDLKIVSGNIEVNAVDNGIKAKDSVSIKAGTIKVDANDAIKVSDKSDETTGTFYMEGGDLTLTAVDDGITATISITITGGKATVAALDKTTNCDGTEEIAEGCLISK